LLKYLAVPNNVGEDWIKLQIGHVKDNLEESKKGMLNEKNLSEIKKAINLIPEDKYRQQKEELMEVFVRKEKELL